MVNLSRRTLREACSCATASAAVSCGIKTVPEGEIGTLDYRLHFQSPEGKTLSPWHSIPLYTESGFLNYVCEIPRNTRAKFEVATTDAGNPIKQDSKKGKPRSYAIDILWNYGMLPQTWEDPTHASEDCDGHIGDNDPVDVVEIGDRTATSGGVYAVKPIGAFAMIDEGELDWKVVAIASTDPRCHLVNDVSDMEEHFPGTLSAIREWFRTYKTFDGKPLNKFALAERCMDREYTMATISQTHAFWKAMVDRTRSNAEGVKMAVGDVPMPTNCFSLSKVAEAASEEKEAQLAEIKVHEGVEKMKEVLEAVQEKEQPHAHGHKRQSLEIAEGPFDFSEHDSKRVELAVVA